MRTTLANFFGSLPLSWGSRFGPKEHRTAPWLGLFQGAKGSCHSYLATRLRGILVATLPPGLFVSPGQPITCPDSEPEPDLAVILGNPEDFRHDHPHTAELVIEICVTSRDYVRSKLCAYASAGVKEVWLVLAPENQIEVHRQPIGGQFAERVVCGPGGQLVSIAVPSFNVGLEVLFAK